MAHLPLRGALLLRRYLERNSLSIAAFAQQHELCPIQIGRLLRGERRRVSVDTALAIQEATRRAVPMRAWCSSEHAEAAQ